MAFGGVMPGIKRRLLFAMTLSTWLSTWLTPAQAKPRSFSTVAELRDFVIAELKKRPGVISVVEDTADPAKFRTVAGDWSSTNDVTNLFGYLQGYPDEDTDQLIQRFINAAIEGSRRIVNEGNLVVVIRNREYIEYMRNLGGDILYEPLGADLVAVYMADEPDAMSPVTSKELPGRELNSFRRIALANVRQWLPKIVSDYQLGSGALYYVDGNTMLSTSLVLLDEFWNSISKRFPGDVWIALPRKDQLFVFDYGDAAVRAAIHRLIDVSFQDNFNLLSQKLYARRNGKIVEELA
jgi:hypothetical protein